MWVTRPAHGVTLGKSLHIAGLCLSVCPDWVGVCKDPPPPTHTQRPESAGLHPVPQQRLTHQRTKFRAGLQICKALFLRARH